jgi:hypothetical protein
MPTGIEGIFDYTTLVDGRIGLGNPAANITDTHEFWNTFPNDLSDNDSTSADDSDFWGSLSGTFGSILSLGGQIAPYLLQEKNQTLPVGVNANGTTTQKRDAQIGSIPVIYIVVTVVVLIIGFFIFRKK